MEKVLVAMLASDKPRKMKHQFVKQVVGVVQQQNQSAVYNMLATCKQSIVESSDEFTQSCCLRVYKGWARVNAPVLASFFTPQILHELLDVPECEAASWSIRLIHETFMILPHHTAEFASLCRIVQTRAIKWVQDHCSFDAIKCFCSLLYTFRNCIPLGVFTAKFCVSIINVVGTFSAPEGDATRLQDYIKGVSGTIGGLMHHVWSNIDEASILQCLQAIFQIISVNSELDPSFALGGIVQHIPTKYVESALKATVCDEKVTDKCMGLALFRMIDWLCWPMTRNIEVWIIAFLKGLGAAHKYTLLIDVTEAKIQQVCDRLQFPIVRQSVLAVMSHMLLSFQHSPQPFHKVIEHIPAVVTQMKAEEVEVNDASLTGLSHLCHALMYLHGGFPDLYEPLLEAIEGLPKPSVETIERLLAESKWTASQGNTVSYLTDLTPKSITGKAGLVNLGNTCYMNSVIQVLFMCDSFTQEVLASKAQPGQTLLLKLQQLFAILSLTQRTAYQPHGFYEASRPPWFTAGSQQDCSEYLRYILDTFHEQEKTLKTTTSSSGSCTLVRRLYGGKLINTYTCVTCSSESTRMEVFTDLPLAFPSVSYKQSDNRSDKDEKAATSAFKQVEGDGISLTELLSYYFRKETLCGDNRYHCGNCQGLQDAVRTIKIIESPVYLFFNLLRFSYNPKTQSRSKIFTEVKYPKTIHLPVHYSSNGASAVDCQLRNRDFNHLSGEAYGLCGVIVHSGLSSDGGHYYCYARHSRQTARQSATDNPEEIDMLDNNWFLFNDSRVSKSSYESFSTVSRKFAKDTAYVLVYRRLSDRDNTELTQDFSVRQEFREIVEKDNKAFLQEQELAQRARAAQKSKQTASNFFSNWRDDSSGGGPPGSCGGGGGGFDAGPRFVC